MWHERLQEAAPGRVAHEEPLGEQKEQHRHECDDEAHPRRASCGETSRRVQADEEQDERDEHRREKDILGVAIKGR